MRQFLWPGPFFFQASCRLRLGPRNRIGLSVRSQPNPRWRGRGNSPKSHPLRCFASLLLGEWQSSLANEGAGRAGAWVRLRRRRGNWCWRDSERGEPAPHAAAGEGTSIPTRGWGTAPFLHLGLSSLPACSFRPNIAPTRASTSPLPPPPPASSHLGHPHSVGHPASSLLQVHVLHLHLGGASCQKSPASAVWALLAPTPAVWAGNLPGSPPPPPPVAFPCS